MSLFKIGSYLAGCTAVLYGSKKLYDYNKIKNNAYVIIHDSDFIKHNSQVHVIYGGMTQFEASWIAYFKCGKRSVSYNNYEIGKNLIDNRHILIVPWYNSSDSYRTHITKYNPCDFKFEYIREMNLPDVIHFISNYINKQRKMNDWIRYEQSDKYPKTGIMAMARPSYMLECMRDYVKSEEDIIKECRSILDAFMQSKHELIFLDKPLIYKFPDSNRIIPKEVIEILKRDENDMLYYRKSIYALRENIDILGKDNYYAIINGQPYGPLFMNLYLNHPHQAWSTCKFDESIRYNSDIYQYHSISFDKDSVYYKINDRLYPYYWNIKPV